MTIQRGDRGVEVVELRDILVRLGLLESSGSSQDLFDEELEIAVRAFQQGRGLTADGTVGTHTLLSLIHI